MNTLESASERHLNNGESYLKHLLFLVYLLHITHSIYYFGETK